MRQSSNCSISVRDIIVSYADVLGFDGLIDLEAMNGMYFFCHGDENRDDVEIIADDGVVDESFFGDTFSGESFKFRG